MTDSDRVAPPSVAILRAIGYTERTMMGIAMVIWPRGGQTELQGAILHAEVQRLVREGILAAKPVNPICQGTKPNRRRYYLTPLGLKALEGVDIDSIMIACEEPTRPEFKPVKIEQK
jgi:hypothetical protein